MTPSFEDDRSGSGTVFLNESNPLLYGRRSNCCNRENSPSGSKLQISLSTRLNAAERSR
jgi:hypothetical protein